MKKLLIAATLLSCGFLYACGDADETSSNDAVVDTAATAPLTDTAKNKLEAAIDQPGSTQDPAAVPPSGSGKLNPPHGQPGHVCELPVGAPLDGSAAPAAGGQQNIQIQPQAAAPPVQQMQAPATTAPGTNPPHGQPGHVCELPVGAPLNK